MTTKYWLVRDGLPDHLLMTTFAIPPAVGTTLVFTGALEKRYEVLSVHTTLLATQESTATVRLKELA
jgi:hypothetical protein